MKFLTVSRNKLEIVRAQLRKPRLVVGRSPTCDLILRAPGIKPIHFLVEWIGSGVFNPNTGSWSIVDISISAESAEGVVLSQDPVMLGDLSFGCEDGGLESTEVIGGQILENLARNRQGDSELLEFVQVRNDSGAIEEVLHFPVKRSVRKIQPSKEFKNFRIERPKTQSDVLMSILLEEMPGAEVILSGKKIALRESFPLREADFLQVKWQGRDFYLRFVDEVDSPAIPRNFFGDPLLFRLTLGVGILVLLLMFLLPRLTQQPEPEKELPRVARVEVPPEIKELPPPPVPEMRSDNQPKQEKPKQEEKKKIVQKNDLPPDLQLKKTAKNEPSKAAAPKAIKAPDEAVKAGLNSPAKIQDVNQVGLLGALNKNIKKGKGVQADKILDEGIISESVTAQDQSRIVLKTSPSGVLGAGSGGSPTGTGNKTLGAASTTLSGVTKYDPNSIGPIARQGGESGYRIGTGVAGTGAGGGSGDNIGSLGAGDFSVEGGGLDRETVRRIIGSYRSQIRTCYERALISNGKLEGRVVYQWKITPEGSVISVQSVKATLDSSNLKACVLEVIQRMVFPKSGNRLATTVIYPFVFQGKR